MHFAAALNGKSRGLGLDWLWLAFCALGTFVVS